MILCDIGNTHYHVYDEEKLYHISTKSSPNILAEQKVYYISVNDKASEKLFEIAHESINLEAFVDINTSYHGLGIDRLMACAAIEDGLVVDAGSAITVDLVQSSNHLGGYILPGLSAYIDTYKAISPKLNSMFNFNVSLEALPQNTKDAISFGVISSIIIPIRELAKNKNIYFTGGDGKFLQKFFAHSYYDEMLVFRGMKKTIEKRGLE